MGSDACAEQALLRSILPVLNAFVILLIITCIYALVGVSFFAETAPELFGSFAHAIIAVSLPPLPQRLAQSAPSD